MGVNNRIAVELITVELTQYNDKIVLLKEELEERENFIEKKNHIIVIDT